MKIGAQVKKARERLGVSQAEYARQLGVSQQAISKIERGGRVHGDTLLRLLKVGGIAINDQGVPKAIEVEA